MSMTEKCYMILRSLKNQHPTSWQEKAAEFIDQQLLFYKEHKNLAKVEIRYEFNENIKNQIFMNRFKDVFERYPNMISSRCMDTDALDYICERYIEELLRFKKEVTNGKLEEAYA